MSITAKLTAEQRVQRAHVWLMKHPNYCLYSGILMLGTVSVSDTVPTACTDGRNVTYGRSFIGGLTDPEVRALILHENLHKAFRHLIMWKRLYDEQAMLANMACDYVINLMIHDSDPTGTDVALPKCGLLDMKYRGMDAQTVFNDLKKQAKDKGTTTCRTKGDQKGTEQPVPPQGEGPHGQRSKTPNSQPGNDHQPAPDGGMDGHDWEGAGDMSREEQEQLARDVDQALRQGTLLAGKMKGNVPREVADVLEAKIDWREALREFVSSFCQDKDESTWRRPSRRWIGQDVYMPSVIGETVGRIVVAVDTSGSIGTEEISQFLGEVRAICEAVKPEGIDLMYWGTHIAQHEKYEQDQLEGLMASTKPRGGGGTNPQCIVDYMSKRKMKAECAVVLTDGITGGCWGEGWTCPTLWAITTEGITSKVGKSVHIY